MRYAKGCDKLGLGLLCIPWGKQCHKVGAGVLQGSFRGTVHEVHRCAEVGLVLNVIM